MLLLCAVCVARGDGVLRGTSRELPCYMIDRRYGNYGIQAFYSHLRAPLRFAGGPPTGRPILYRLSVDGGPRRPILFSSSSDVRSSPACSPPLPRPASRLLRTHWAISPPALAAAMSQRQLRWNRAATCTRADGHRSRRRDADGMPDCQSARGQTGKAARGAAKTQASQRCLKKAAADTCILMGFLRPRTRQRCKGPLKMRLRQAAPTAPPMLAIDRDHATPPHLDATGPFTGRFGRRRLGQHPRLRRFRGRRVRARVARPRPTRLSLTLRASSATP